ncbi:MAG: hypothetical protein HUJ60_05695, partial [Bacilli bacterium]|nr:hypothetical protein [Bacilli bacterium]
MVIVLLCLLAIASMIALIVFLPNVTVKGFHFSTFYLPPLLLALVFLIFPLFDKTALWDAFFTNSPLNPLKILVLFLSISVLSISLDNSGFFAYLASVAIKKYHASQHALFFALFILISLTTIFTSNDIVILTFTPFIIYLSKKGKINPIPYLIMEFVAGNSFSMLLEIGNPTNIFLSLAYNISFLDYLLSMALPSLLIGMSSLLILLFLFRKDLKKPILDFDVAPHPI